MLTQHGVFLEIAGLGVLLTGRSGLGKSEIALALIHQGHILIADDATELSLMNNRIVGTCPSRIRNFLEVRGLGVINIKKLFGESSTKVSAPLDLIIKLVDVHAPEIQTASRLHGLYGEEMILEHPIPSVIIPVGPGRNLAALIETAVRNQQLKREGYDPVKDFCEQDSSS